MGGGKAPSPTSDPSAATADDALDQDSIARADARYVAMARSTRELVIVLRRHG